LIASNALNKGQHLTSKDAFNIRLIHLKPDVRKNTNDPYNTEVTLLLALICQAIIIFSEP